MNTKVTLTALAFAFGLLLSSAPKTAHAQLQSINASCTTFRIEQNDHGDALFVAQCQTDNFDEARRAEFNLDHNIGVVNGFLSFDGLYISRDCHNIRLADESGDNPTVLADCRVRHGDYKTLALDLSQEVFNRNGELVEQ